MKSQTQVDGWWSREPSRISELVPIAMPPALSHLRLPYGLVLSGGGGRGMNLKVINLFMPGRNWRMARVPVERRRRRASEERPRDVGAEVRGRWAVEIIVA